MLVLNKRSLLFLIKICITSLFFQECWGVENINKLNILSHLDKIPSVERIKQDFNQGDNFNDYAQQQIAIAEFSDILSELANLNAQPPLTEQERKSINYLRSQFLAASSFQALNILCKGDAACRSKANERYHAYNSPEFKRSVFDKYSIPEDLRRLQKSREEFIKTVQQPYQTAAIIQFPTESIDRNIKEKIDSADLFMVLLILVVCCIFSIKLWFGHKRGRFNLTLNKPSRSTLFSSAVALGIAFAIIGYWYFNRYDWSSQIEIKGRHHASYLWMLFIPLIVLYFTWIKKESIDPNISREDSLKRFGTTTNDIREGIDNYFNNEQDYIQLKVFFINTRNQRIEITARRGLFSFDTDEKFALRCAYHLLNENIWDLPKFRIMALAIIAGKASGKKTGQISYTINEKRPEKFWEGIAHAVVETPNEMIAQYLANFDLSRETVVDIATTDMIIYASKPTTDKYYRALCNSHGIDFKNAQADEYEPSVD